MSAPIVRTLAPTFDDPRSCNLRAFVEYDGGSPCTVEFWVWDALFPPGRFVRYASLPGKTTGQTVQYHSSILGFKYQLRYYVRALNGVDFCEGVTVPYWPLRASKRLDGQPWLVLTDTSSWWGADLHFVVTTDISCHLWLAWSDHEPFIKSRAHKKRGTVMWHDGEHGLVVNGTIEQTETGDTLSHTIVVPFADNGLTLWWFLLGEVDRRLSPSRTPFWSATRDDPVSIPCVWASHRGGDSSYPWSNEENSFGFLPTFNFKLTRLQFNCRRHYDYPAPEFIWGTIWDADANYKPTSPLYTPIRFTANLPVYPTEKTFSAGLPSIPMQSGHKYAISIASDYSQPEHPMIIMRICEGTFGQGVPIGWTYHHRRKYHGGVWGGWSAISEYTNEFKLWGLPT